jgi:hypothetical protein
MGLQEENQVAYVEAVRKLYPECKVEEFEHQGYCSFTLIVRPLDCTPGYSSNRRCEDDIQTGISTLIVQIRPPQHALSLTITYVAAGIYPDLAPRTIQLFHVIQNGLLMYEMPKLPGSPMSLLQPQVRSPDAEIQHKQTTLIKSLAAILAQSWSSASEAHRFARADSPISFSSSPNMLSYCPGKVGQLIISKLQALARNLPGAELQQRAQSVLDKIQTIDAYPVVLTHGDLIPSNILVHHRTWLITGLVDWAEAEYLPFGTCLYGLEHLLGYMASASQFVYFENAPQLRRLFWECLFAAVPEVKARRDEVYIMRDLGVLLWHGFAWDEGKIDRVVDEERDGLEMARLRAFLSAE